MMRSDGVMRVGFVCAAVLLFASGCRVYSDRADNGVTFYCPGAGNFDFGDAGIRKGLQEAGYSGEVAAFVWTISFNPAIDQSARPLVRARAGEFARVIEEYARRYPGRPINVIGLSAGSGVAIWALEDLDPSVEVENVVLLGSSLWYRYDVSKALRRVRGKIYNYYSPHDAVLQGPMKVFGTIDGKFGEDGAGAVGLRSSGDGRVVNIRWEPMFADYGYTGGHTDSTNPRFVERYISQHIVGVDGAVSSFDTALATERE